MRLHSQDPRKLAYEIRRLSDRITKLEQHRLERLRWKSDHDDSESIDDLFAYGEIHLERMNNGYYWIGITVGGETIHIDITGGKKLKAKVRK